jgi:putative transposase
MPRPPRIQAAGGTYHLTCHAVRHSALFLDSFDFDRYLAGVGDVVKRYGWRCFAYCLMTNHAHLLVETPNPDLARGMHRLNGRYAGTFNRRWAFDGHVFNRRYGSVLVETEWHFLEAARYVVLNPVRAGICRRPEDWPWSSYGATIGLVAPPEFLAVDDLLASFGSPRDVAAASFADFVRAGQELAA